ncbi:hypothetical protein GmHk_19G055415 [Glycine max]|nr:hypothetical protein GmHk_19G055415 [Glycine max]
MCATSNQCPPRASPPPNHRKQPNLIRNASDRHNRERHHHFLSDLATRTITPLQPRPSPTRPTPLPPP